LFSFHVAVLHRTRTALHRTALHRTCTWAGTACARRTAPHVHTASSPSSSNGRDRHKALLCSSTAVLHVLHATR
jgi:hypothetical protein